MRLVYGVTLVVGVIALLVWVARVAIAATVDGWADVDPDLRYGRRGRLVLAAVLGFGLAGMSTSYAGWPTGLAFVAAVGGALGLAAVAHRYGPSTPT